MLKTVDAGSKGKYMDGKGEKQISQAKEILKGWDYRYDKEKP